MKILSWNARGLGNPGALRQLRNLTCNTSPTLVFLSETRLRGSYARNFHRKTGFDAGLAVDSCGRSGGLILLWNSDCDVRIQSYSKGHIDAHVKNNDGQVWRIIGFYGNPQSSLRHHSWDLLSRLHSLNNLPWCVCGDFNEIMGFSEKSGGSDRNRAGMEDFRVFLEACDLYELPFKGEAYTWDNGRGGDQNILERLDRVVVSDQWRDLFSEAELTHLDFWGSDHRALSLDLVAHPKGALRRGSEFRFEPWWLDDPECEEVVTETWTRQSRNGSTSTLSQKLSSCAAALRNWSKEKFGSITKKVKIAQDRVATLNNSTRTTEIVTASRAARSELDALLFKEERIWRQRSRVEWLKGGDLNTKFFHHKASHRRRKNRVKGMFDQHNVWRESTNAIAENVSNYFRDLFTSSNPSETQIEAVLSAMTSRLTIQDTDRLEAPFTPADIKKALFSMGPTKSPGRDGFQSIFFQKLWHVVGGDVTNFCLGFLNNSGSIREFNSTNLVLIPKVSNPDRVQDFRPISLCSVIYKIISKALAHRLKPCLETIIAPTQSAFVPGRLISDNTIIDFELIHSMRQRNNGRKGWLSLKLDMSKAYDRIEWPYVIAVMRKLGFSERWCALIHECISTTSLSFVVSGTRSGNLAPSRGLRQGCSLSPYLFLLCAEGLSALFSQAERDGSLMGLACNRRSPHISHLLFADDSIVFCRANMAECATIQSILGLYERASGQHINMEKSSISFSPNVDTTMKDNILAYLGLSRANMHDKYLGLPSIVGRNKRQVFATVKERVGKKLRSWKGRLFSQAGREVLIKAVALAMPTYAMSIFKIPDSLRSELQSMMSRYWWIGDVDDRSIHWLSWERLCKPKGSGGLEFRDLSTFNQVMVAKQSWRIIQHPTSLMARVLRGKYFFYDDLLSAKLGSNPSYIWRSLLWGRDLLARGVRWRVGDGNSIRVFDDPWVPFTLSYKPLTPKPAGLGDLRVSSLLSFDGTAWNQEKLEEILWPVDVNCVSRMVLGLSRRADFIVWAPDPLKGYSVKSGYRLGVIGEGENSFSANSFLERWWKALWAMNVPSKIKMWVWRCFHGAVPCFSRIASRGVGCDERCRSCGRNESITHMLFNCYETTKFWKSISLGALITSMAHMRQDEVILGVWSSVPQVTFEIFSTYCWLIWRRRNDIVHGTSPLPWDIIESSAVSWLTEFKRSSVCPAISPTSRFKAPLRWSPPPPGGLKLNTDASISAKEGLVGVGAVVRDCSGRVVTACARRFRLILSPLEAECLALRTGLEWARAENMRLDLVESDSKLAVEAVHISINHGSPDPVLADIPDLLSATNCGTCSFSPRETNEAAHLLARKALSLETDMYWRNSIPAWIDLCIYKDMYSV